MTKVIQLELFCINCTQFIKIGKIKNCKMHVFCTSSKGLSTSQENKLAGSVSSNLNRINLLSNYKRWDMKL